MEALLNLSKSVRHSFWSRPNMSLVKYSIGEADICLTECQRDLLSLIISASLSWIKHYDCISRNAYISLNLPRCSINKQSYITAKKLLYLSLIRSRHFDYLAASAY